MSRHRERLEETPSPRKRERLRLEDVSEAPEQSASPRIRKPAKEHHLTLIDAIADPQLFAPFFKDPETWIAWGTFIAACFGLDMDEEQLAIYRECTGRTDVPHEQFKEIVLTCGRRAGKSYTLALIAVWLACFHSYKKYLSEGELGVVMVLAADKAQAKVILGYVRGFVKKIRMLARMVRKDTQFGLELSNSVAIEITASNFKTVRGRTVVAALCDEVCFWSSEYSSSPDTETVAAIRPAMSMIPNSMLLIASSPYAKRGVLFEQWKKYHGKNDKRVLSWHAPTERMNPRVDPAVIAQAYEDDAVAASAEYGAIWRTDIESFVSRDAVEACMSAEHERGYSSSNRYFGFVDPSGGAHDSMTMAIAHVEKGITVLDVLREKRPPFSPEGVVEDFSAIFKLYGIRKVLGDKYAGEWPREQFKKHGIVYDPSAKPKSQLYTDFLPLLNSRKVDLLANDRLLNQLASLERRTARSGKDSVDHPPNGMDDVANAVAGVVTSCGVRRYNYDASLEWVGSMGGSSSNNDQSNAAQRMSALVNIHTMRGLLR